MGPDDIRGRILEVLDWAASVFRPGTGAHGELAGLAARLRDPGVRLSPMLGEDERSARESLGNLVREAAALRETLGRLPAEDGLDPALAEAVEERLAAMREAFGRLVTYRQVIQALGGSWGDSDLGEAISTLVRELREHAGREAEGPAAAPAP